MSLEWTALVWAHLRQVGSAKLLLLAIARVADKDGSTTALNIPALVYLVGTKERNIQTLLTKLEAAGELGREFGVGPSGRTRYILLHPSLNQDVAAEQQQVDSPLQTSAQPVNPVAPCPQPNAPSRGALEDTALRKEGQTEGGETSAPASASGGTPEPPTGESELPGAPLGLWKTARTNLQPLDEVHLRSLAAELDGPTNGYGSYWLGRDILAASMSDSTFAANPRGLNLVRAILRRWQHEGSYGSDTAAYLTRKEHRHAPVSQRPTPRWSHADRRPAHGGLSQHKPPQVRPEPPCVPSLVAERTATDRRPCPTCGADQWTMPVSWKGGIVYMWQPCETCAERWEQEYQATVAQDLAARRTQAERELGDTGLKRISHFTFDTFQPAWLQSTSSNEHPATIARRWLHEIEDLSHGSYADDAVPRPALYFYSPGKGRGKTHLAGAIANAARAKGKLVAFLEETSYLERRWSCQLTEIERLTALPGDHAWLTVIDDLGQRGKASASVSDAWYAVINRRWLKGGWTIFTSNRFPEELVDQGTINEATYSRLMQMIGMRVVFFDGDDRRLA